MSAPVDMNFDEFDLWAESSEETTRKSNEISSLTMLANLDRWINDTMQAVGGVDDDGDNTEA